MTEIKLAKYRVLIAVAMFISTDSIAMFFDYKWSTANHRENRE